MSGGRKGICKPEEGVIEEEGEAVEKGDAEAVGKSEE